MKTLIIPDIHLKHKLAEKIITRESPDQTIFLGDYFDDFGDTPERTRNTADWLKKSMKDKKRVHLLGNHDLSYSYPKYACAGFSVEKAVEIAKSGVNLHALKLFHWINNPKGYSDILCTHAGLTKPFLEHISRPTHYPQIHDKLTHELSNLTPSQLSMVSSVRGGKDKCGSIIWCDCSELEPIDGISQIFGHTPSMFVRSDKHCICLDTHLKDYAVFEDGKINIRASNEEPEICNIVCSLDDVFI